MYMKFVSADNFRFWIVKQSGWYIPAVSAFHAKLRIASPSLTMHFTQRELKAIYDKF